MASLLLALVAAGALGVGPGVGYVDVVRLAHQSDPARDGRLLVTFEEASGAGVPVYASGDDAGSWRLLARVGDQPHRGDPRWSLRWQPNLLELDGAAGDLRAGDVLLAANSTRRGAGGAITDERLQLYGSSDGGRTWRWRSDIARGTGAPEDPGNSAVWEPQLRRLPDGALVAWWSSEQHKPQGYNQLLSHRISRDGGRTWGPEQVDVARAGEVERPGMPVVEALRSGGYVMSYEDIDGPHNGQVFLKRSRDALDWGDPSDRGAPVATASGAWPAASPVVRRIDDGSPRGVLVVLAERGGGEAAPDGRQMYWNAADGRGPWWRAPAPAVKLTGNIHAGWTQALLASADGRELIHLTTSSDPAAPQDADRNRVIEGRAPLRFDRYEGEDALRRDAVQIFTDDASAGAKVRIARGGAVTFPLELARPVSTLRLRVAPVDLPAPPEVRVDGRAVAVAEVRADRGRWRILEAAAGPLPPGAHAIQVAAPAHALDLDWIEAPPADGSGR